MLAVGTCASSGRGGGGVMPGRLRVQFEGATYRVMSRGNGRQDIVVDDRDRRYFVEAPGAQVGRSGWELIRFVLLSNHFHLLVRTPRADLAGGMQRLLSAHAGSFAARHRRPGHVFQDGLDRVRGTTEWLF